MVQTCRRCARVNPEDAAYCYFDGIALGGPVANGGPILTGAQTFHSPFTLASGRTCGNFDELALACQENWAEALELLQQGYLESYLGSLGRADLALAVREAARFPDRDRGLDQFLAKLPSNVVAPPRLEVEPTELNLGQLQPGEDRHFGLNLTNQGMRLLYGSVSCDCGWLTVGEAPGAPQKLFQFKHELDVPVHVRGQLLRARNRVFEGRLIVESNGGTATALVRVEVPVKPFPEGVLAGARSPRQAAEMAKAAPKEAAPFFENGAMARWYQDNGWTYPVQGPAATDVGAIQQFFEALGLTKAPKVEISEQAVHLRGTVGVPLQHELELRTVEKRAVYARGASSQGWLEVGRPRLSGRTATIPLLIPAVPDREGETLQATVRILTNGNQRFKVKVTLEVIGSFSFDTEAPMALPAESAPASSTATTMPAPARETVPAPATLRARALSFARRWIHAVPALVLALALSGVVIWDLAYPPSGEDGTLSPYVLDDPEPHLGVKFSPTMRFGLLMLKDKDPLDKDRFKRLTMEEDGRTNNTCIRLDGHENLFGLPPGDWARGKAGPLKQVKLDRGRRGWMSSWWYNQEKVLVRQTVEIVPGGQSRVLDTCLVHYLIENRDTIPHDVGIRVMIDTFIGSEDGVPFVIPGQPGFLETKRVFEQKEIPDFIEALERPNPADPGAIAHLAPKIPGVKIQRDDPEPEAIDNLVVCRWPGNSEKRWQWDYEPMNEPPNAPKDSCVVLYGPENRMAPGERRALAFTYGLGRIASGGGELGLTAGGSFQPGKVFTVVAFVKDSQEGQKVKLLLPKGLSLAPGADGEEQQQEQTVAKAKHYGQVSWRVQADKEGSFPLEVVSGGQTEHYRIQIKRAGLFN
jgi:hypothetical protein